MLAHSSPVEHALLGIGAAAAAAGYVFAWLRLPDRSMRRPVSWVAGLAGFVVATSPSIEAWAQRTFTGHMVQHLVLIVVAAPLFAAAEPVRVLFGRPGALRRSHEARRAGRWWRSWGPPVAVACFVAVLYLTHLTSVYDRALSNRLLHDAEHAVYLLAAILVWSTLRTGRGLDAPLRIAAVFAVIAATAFLGVVLITSPDALIETYVRRLGARDALTDQRTAASLMWVGGMLSTLPLLLAAVWNWASAEQRATERVEAIRDARRVDADVPPASTDARVVAMHDRPPD